MKAKELMIGDWVLDKAVSERPVQVKQINDKNVHYKHGNGYMSTGVELLEPIPLTSDMLLNNGFEHHFGEWFWINGDVPVIRLFQRKDDPTFWIKAEPFDIGIKYVHELQHIVPFYLENYEFKFED